MTVPGILIHPTKSRLISRQASKSTAAPTFGVGAAVGATVGAGEGTSVGFSHKSGVGSAGINEDAACSTGSVASDRIIVDWRPTIMAKTQEEPNALKEEVENVNRKLHELSEEELEQVNGGFENLIKL